MSGPVKTPGRVFLLDSGSGAVVKYHGAILSAGMSSSAEYFEIGKAITDPLPSTGSRRLKEKYGVTLDGVLCATRPFDFYLYAYATTLNTYHCRAVRAKAKDIAGGPWKITGEGTQAQRDEITAFFTGLFTDRSFSDGLMNVWTDFEALGNSFLEVVPDAKGNPAELAHIPSTEMWMRLDNLGYVQQKNGQYAHFRGFGIDPEKFEALPEKDPLAVGSDVSSVAHFTQYFPWSLYYGIPSIMPAWNRMALSVLETEYNLQFFGNNAVPDYAVILEGEWSDDAEQKIQEHFRKYLKGQAHKTLVFTTPEGGKITFEKLTSDNAKEGSFRLLRTDCRDEVLHAHGVPPSKVGIHEPGKLGGSTGFEQNQEYKNAIVTPGRAKLTALFARIIALRWPDSKLAFAFEPYDTDDLTQNADIDQTYLQNQVLTPNQVLARRFPELPQRLDGDTPLPDKGGATAEAGDQGTAIAGLQKRVRRQLQEAKR